MGKIHWPQLSHKRPDDLREHAAALRKDFEAIDDHVQAIKASRRQRATLPSGFTSKVSDGISQGVTEAVARGYCPVFPSEIDRDLFCKTVLQSITTEAAAKAHDRIPLLEFDTLKRSYNELVDKLTRHPAFVTKSREKTANSKSRSARYSLESHTGLSTGRTTPRVEDMEPRHRARGDEMDLEVDEDVQVIRKAFRKNENNGKVLDHQLQDLEGRHQYEGTPYTNTERTQNDVRDAEEAGEAGMESNAAQREEEHNCDNGDDVKHVTRNSNATEVPHYYDQAAHEQTSAGTGNAVATTSSWRIPVHIHGQATVNRLCLMTPHEIVDRLHHSLRKVIAGQEQLLGTLQLSDPELSDNGDLVFLDRNGTLRDHLHSTIDPFAWTRQFEADISPSMPTYKFNIHSFPVESINISTRKEKAAAIQRLLDANIDRLESLRGRHDVVDLRWIKSQPKKPHSALQIEVTNRHLANEALERGLKWEQVQHGCDVLRSFRLRRCNRCQTYGHEQRGCKAAVRCGKCAGQHSTDSCKSLTRKCAACGDKHKARNRKCPIKLAKRRELRFYTPNPTSESGQQEPSIPILPLDTSNSDPSRQDPQIKVERFSPPYGLISPSVKSTKKHSFLGQVEELSEVARTGEGAEMSKLRKQLGSLEAEVRALGGVFVEGYVKSGKRKPEEAMMSGALQDPVVHLKRIKREEN